MSTYPRWISVESMKDFREAMNFKLKVRRIGSGREGIVKKCVGHHEGHAIIEYPARDYKGKSTCKVSKITNYEIEPRRAMEKFLHQISSTLGNSLIEAPVEIPKIEEDRPDIDILGIFLENNTIARYLHYEKDAQSTGGKSAKARLLSIQAIECIRHFTGDNTSKKASVYGMQASLRILFWCYYCKINRTLSQNKTIIKSIANVMDNDNLPLPIRFRAARIIYFLGEEEEMSAKLPRFSHGYASCLLSGVAGLTQQHNSGANLGDEDKKIIQLAKYDLADGIGKEPEYFY